MQYVNHLNLPSNFEVEDKIKKVYAKYTQETVTSLTSLEFSHLSSLLLEINDFYGVDIKASHFVDTLLVFDLASIVISRLAFKQTGASQ